MNTKIIATTFEHGLSNIEIKNKIGHDIDLQVLNKINNMQLQSNDVVELIEKLILNKDNLICLDYNDVMAVLAVEGVAYVGLGYSIGKESATKVVEALMCNLQNNRSIYEGTTMLINFIGNKEVGIFEVNKALDDCMKALDYEPEVFFSISCNEKLDREVYVMLIVTGLV